MKSDSIFNELTSFWDTEVELMSSERILKAGRWTFVKLFTF